MRRRLTLVILTIVLILQGIFSASNASANIYTNGTVALGCSSSIVKTDLATRFTMQVTCSPTATTFAWSWAVTNSDYTGIDAYNRGMKWTITNGGASGGGKAYNMGSGYIVHGNYKMPNNSSVHQTDVVTLTNLDYGQLFSAVIVDFSFGTNPCLGKPASSCPQAIT